MTISTAPSAPISMLRRDLSGGSESPSAVSAAPWPVSTFTLTCILFTSFMVARALSIKLIAGPPAVLPELELPAAVVAVGGTGTGVSVGGTGVGVGARGVGVGVSPHPYKPTTVT